MQAETARSRRWGKVAFPVGDSLIGWDVFRWAVRRIDDYGRLEAIVSLQRYTWIFSSAWFTPISIVLGLILIVWSQQLAASRTLGASPNRVIVDANDQPYVPISLSWLWTVLLTVVGAVLCACLFGALWLRFYEPVLPTQTATITVPTLCKTVDCFPKPSPASVVASSPTNVSAPKGIPIVGNKGTVNNPTVNNMDGRAGINVGQAKGSTISDNISVGLPGISVGSAENTTISGNMSFRSVNDGTLVSGYKLNKIN